MKYLYDDKEKNQMLVYLRNSYIIISVSLITVIAILMILFLSADKENYYIFFYINSFISISYIWGLILFVNLFLIPMKRKLSFIRELESIGNNIITCKVKEVSESVITLSKMQFKMVETEVTLDNRKQIKKIYIDINKSDLISDLIEKDKYLKLDVRNNIIFSFEVTGDLYD